MTNHFKNSQHTLFASFLNPKDCDYLASMMEVPLELEEEGIDNEYVSFYPDEIQDKVIDKIFRKISRKFQLNKVQLGRLEFFKLRENSSFKPKETNLKDAIFILNLSTKHAGGEFYDSKTENILPIKKGDAFLSNNKGSAIELKEITRGEKIFCKMNLRMG